MSCCEKLIEAINKYIQKAENDLKEQLKLKGYREPTLTVEAASELEEAFAKAITEENKSVLDAFKSCETIEEFYEEVWPTLKADDNLRKLLAGAYRKEITSLVKPLVDRYVVDSDPTITVSSLTRRTTGWIKTWGEQLSELMSIDNAEMLENIFVDALDEGKGISTVIQALKREGIRDNYPAARRTAITEVLTAHSVAQQEAIDQSPAVDRKCWRHSGSAKIKPRENHVAMNGQIVPKTEPFTLLGADGVTYRPMYPRDTSLPAGERINCHCLSQPIVDDDILGMSLEERKQLQAEAKAKIDADYEAELNRKNKAKAGIDEETVKLDWIKQKSKAGQIKYLGSKRRWALVETGVVDKDEQLFKTIKTPKGKITIKKTLKELRDNGIITVTESRAEHSWLGEYKDSSDRYPNGRLTKGGHGQAAIDECTRLGIPFEINGEYSNGVRFGNVPSSALKQKRTDNGQLWFPENWTEEDILLAGTSVVNSSAQLIKGTYKTAVYKNVAVRVYIEASGRVGTICPDIDQMTYINGVKIKWNT